MLARPWTRSPPRSSRSSPRPKRIPRSLATRPTRRRCDASTRSAQPRTRSSASRSSHPASPAIGCLLMGRSMRFAAGTGICLGTTLSLGASAHAAEFTVTSLADDGGGAGTTLREALISAQANNNPATIDTIVFQSGLTGTITLNGTQLPTVDEPLTIQGPGADLLTLSGNDASRILNINTGAGHDVTIEGLTLTRGDATGGFGGAIFKTDADLFIRNSAITESHATFNGGGVSSKFGMLVLDRATISGNTAGDDGGGLVFDETAGTVATSTISGNTAEQGGGIAVIIASLSVSSSTITGNRAVGPGPYAGGGGISSVAGDPDPILRNTIVAG